MKLQKVILVSALTFGLSACSSAQMQKHISQWSDGFPSFFKMQHNNEGYAFGEKLLSENSREFVSIRPFDTESGIHTWYVYDNSVPVIDIKFSFDKGSVYDISGKEGTASLIAATLNEGAGKYNSQEFQKIMNDKAIDLYFDASKDKFAGHLRTTKPNLEQAVELLQLAILSPRFDDEAVERMKNSMVTSLKYSQSKAGWHAGKAMREFVFEGHPYSRSSEGMLKTIPEITQEDLKDLWKQIAVRKGLKIGITGDLTQAEAGKIVDKVFAQLPKSSQELEVNQVQLKRQGKIMVVPYDASQTYLLAVQDGISRQHPDWFVAQIINYTLAGGGFNSRLMEAVRVENSLTYGIHSSIVDQKYGPIWVVQSDVANDGVKKTIDIIKSEWRRLQEQGISEQELSDAKSNLIGGLPLALDSTGAISSLMVQMQEDKLSYDYLESRSKIIEAITIEDVKRVAQTILQPDKLTFILAGKFEQR